MKFKKQIFIIILAMCNLPVVIGNINSDSLLVPKSESPKQASLFLFTAGYRMPVNKNNIISSGHGAYIEGGINAGRLISKNLVVGLYAGWAFMDKLWTTSFNDNFSHDYDASVKKDDNFSALDSSIINSSTQLIKNTTGNSNIIPGCETRSFHNYSMYYGVMIKLPYKYIPTLKIFKGTTRTYYKGEGNIATKNTDYNIFEIRRAMYGCELMIINLDQLLHGKKIKKKSANNRGGGLSIYYETSNFYNSSLYFYDGTTTRNIPLQKFTSTSFLKKYKQEVSYGFKLCFYIM